MTNNTLDASIPMLTEIIPTAQADSAPETASPTEVAIAVPAKTEKEELAIFEEHAAAAWDEAQWNKLEREVRERVLCQVLERIDFVLEQRVRDSLADVLQIAVEGLATDLKSGLHHSIKDIVTHAITQEITKLQTAKE